MSNTLNKNTYFSGLMKLRITIIAILAAFCTNAQVLRGPYLQSPTSTGIKVMWRTQQPTDSRVVYGLTPQNLDNSAFVNDNVTDHTVALTGLVPNTKYYYTVGTSTTLEPANAQLQYFYTSPTIGTVQPIRIWAMGDFGKGNSNQQKVRDSYAPFTGNQRTDVWVWLGDNVYQDGTEEEYSTKVFDSIWGYKELMKNLPFMPSPGNHDLTVIGNHNPVQSHSMEELLDAPYFKFADVFTNGECGGVPSGTEHYYSYDYANVHFISINSELASVFNADHDLIGARLIGDFNGSEFTTWLTNDLQANTQPWVIAYWHQPPHTDGSHESTQFWQVNMEAMRENICPILENFGVDLILNGHSHVYERSYLLNGYFGLPADFNPQQHVLNGTSGNLSLGEPYIKYKTGPLAKKGTIYSVVGNSGSKDDNPTLQHPAMYYAEGCDTCLGSLFIKVHGDTLTGEYLTHYGQVNDRFTIIKRDSTVNVNEMGVSVTSFNVFPNPSKKEFTVSFNLTQKGAITLGIYNMEGKLVGNLLPNKNALNQGVVNIKGNFEQLGLKPGMYSVRLQTVDNKIIARTIVYTE